MIGCFWLVPHLSVFIGRGNRSSYVHKKGFGTKTGKLSQSRLEFNESTTSGVRTHISVDRLATTVGKLLTPFGHARPRIVFKRCAILKFYVTFLDYTSQYSVKHYGTNVTFSDEHLDNK